MYWIDGVHAAGNNIFVSFQSGHKHVIVEQALHMGFKIAMWYLTPCTTTVERSAEAILYAMKFWVVHNDSQDPQTCHVILLGIS